MNFKKGPILSFLLLFLLAGCASGPVGYGSQTPAPKTATSRPYRITNSHMKNKLFTPKQHYEHYEEGYASYYGGRDVFHGRKTSTGEIFDKNKLMAAHRTLPLPCVVRVTNIDSKSRGYGRSIKVRVVDRGPFAHINKRIIDVSEKSAKLLGFYKSGTAKVRLETLVDESIRLAQGKGYRQDNRILLAKGARREQPKIMLAMKPSKKIQLASLSATNLKFLTKDTPVPRVSPFAHQTATQEVSPPDRILVASNKSAFDQVVKPTPKPSSIADLIENGSMESKSIPEPMAKPRFADLIENESMKSKNIPAPMAKPKFAELRSPKRLKLNESRPKEAKSSGTFLASGSETGIFVQAGSYTKLKNAQNLGETLKSNLEINQVRVSPLKAPDETIYRVRLGPFDNSEQAEYLLAQLEQQGHDDACIVYE